MRLDVVIPTIGRSQFLAALLADLAVEAPEGTDILVVDQSAPAEAERVARMVGQYRAVRLEHRPPGLPAARNHGIAATSGDVVLFLDDDVRLLPGCLSAHLAAYSDPRVGGVVGRIVERSVRPNARGTVNRVGRSGRVRTNLMGTARCEIATLKGANMSYRRLALQSAGLFDVNYEGTAFLEDADLSTRVRREGWSLRFEPDAEVVHLSAPSGGVRTGSLRATERWRFENTGYFVRRHRGMLGMAPVVPTFAAIAARRALEWRQPEAVPELLTALLRGWRRGA